jgi:hypothetical protein
MIHPIKKSYAPWVRGAPGALRQIMKAEQISEFMRTEKGVELYKAYLAQHPEQVYAGAAPSAIAKGQPTPSDVHVNQPLSMISIAFLQDLNEFIADKVFPNIPVQKQSDRYYFYPRGNWFRSQAKERAPATESAGSGYDIDSTPTYVAKPIALHKDVDDQLRSNADPMIDLDRDATEFVTRQLALKREKDWAARFFATGVWTGSTTGGDITPATLWSAPGSTPIEDIRAQKSSIKTKTGFKPNTLVLGNKVWDVLQDHPEFTDRIKYTERGIVGLDLIAAVLELDQVLVATAVENTAAEGLAESMSFVLDSKDALLCYSNPRPSLMTPSAGYIFSWAGYLGAGPAGQRMSRFRMQQLRADRVEGEMAYDMKVVAPEMGAFFNNAVA